LALLEYIKDQLLFNDAVTLPGLGSFEIRKSASRIQGKKIIPPTAQVIFNPDNSLDNGVLSKSIASAEDISQDEASQKVLEYIDEILFALNKGESYVFAGFGKLYRDAENVYRFEKDPVYQIEFETYGLESFELDPIEEAMQAVKSPEDEKVVNQIDEIVSKTDTESKRKGSPAKENKEKSKEKSTLMEESAKSGRAVSPTKENKSNRSIFWILTGAVVVILLSFVILRMTTNLLDGPGLLIFNNEKNYKQGKFPEDENWDLESTLNNELGEAIDSMSLQENALTIKETAEPVENQVALSSEYQEFHIIAGSFKDKEKAGVLQQSLTEQGYPALVIQQGDKLFRVSAISFKSKDQGLKELNRFKQKTRNNAAWLLGLN
jgi:nucleoid DNA-binding protein